MKKLKYFTVVGGAAVLALGAAAHFFYEWSGNNFFVGMFSPVNESVWEHMKLAFFPMLLFSFAANLFLKKDCPGAASSALCGALLSTALIPVIFYTYSGVLGYNSLLPDILTFVFSVLTGVLTFFCLCKSGAAETFFSGAFYICRGSCGIIFYLHLFSARNMSFSRSLCMSFSFLTMDICQEI